MKAEKYNIDEIQKTVKYIEQLSQEILREGVDDTKKVYIINQEAHKLIHNIENYRIH